MHKQRDCNDNNKNDDNNNNNNNDNIIIIVIKEATSPRYSSMGTYLQNHPANLQENINKGTLK